jgi:hypothetical protein
MSVIANSVGSNQTANVLSSASRKSAGTDLELIPSFVDLLNLSKTPSTSQTASTTGTSTATPLTDWEIKALTQSGKSPQEVAETFISAGATIYDIARATGAKVGELRELAAELGVDYIDPYKDSPALASAMDKLSDNAGGFVRIGVDETGQYHLQTAGSGGIFGWQNMDQIRMSNDSLPGKPYLFGVGMLSQQEIDSLTPFLPDINDTSFKHTAGGYPTAWSLQEWKGGMVQAAYQAHQAWQNQHIDQEA